MQLIGDIEIKVFVFILQYISMRDRLRGLFATTTNNISYHQQLLRDQDNDD